MKRILSIILAVLMLIPLCVLGISAEGEGANQNATCTVGAKNIANEASVGYVGAHFWAIDGAKLVDNNKEHLAHSPVYDFSYTFKFGSLKTISSVVALVNGEGHCSSCGYAHTADAGNSVRGVSIKLSDDTGKIVYESDVINLYDDTDPENIVLGTEAKFEFDAIAVSTVEIFVKTPSWGGAYFREVEIFQEIGEHAWVADAENTVPSSCEAAGVDAFKCACGATKEIQTNQHTVEEWTTILAPTTTASGIAQGECTVPGCGGKAAKELPRLSLTDNQNKLNLNNISVSENPYNIQDYLTENHPDYKKDFNNNMYIPNVDRNPEALFDNIIDTGTNFWCGTAFRIRKILVYDDPATEEDETQFDIVKPDDPETPDKDETEYAYDTYYSTLTIDFDQSYILTQAELYVYSNWNYFTIEFKGADGNAIKSITKTNFETSGCQRLIFTGDVYGESIKSIVITVTGSKWEGGKGLAFTEMKLSAHECEFLPEDIANGTTENCVTTFSGTCLRCKSARTDAKIVSHTWEKDETDPTQDKIVQTLTEVTCYGNGKVEKHCTVCDQNIALVVPATEAHVWGETKYDKENVTYKPTCGDVGLGYERCTNEGCTATSEIHTVPPQGEHNYKWTEKVGFEADYTHDGVKAFTCAVCSQIDESKGTQVSPMLDSKKLVSAREWSIRYTDFVSPRATFKISMGTINQIELDGFSVKVFGVVQKGEETREVQVYGDGARGLIRKDGTFSLVVKNAQYSDDYKFSVRVEITCIADSTASTGVAPSRNLSTAGDGQVSAKDIATYYLAPNRADSLDEHVKALYEQIAK
ncbi:MAG: hypothetical protein E7622_06685 [Ruminococcaceae bacterium]|nr:hypothetical protein [Oscillospiraceae bacterium]